MYFKTYTPSTKSENCETARAFHTYNAVRSFCGKDKPRAKDYYNYLACNKVKHGCSTLAIADAFESFGCPEEAAPLREAISIAVAALNAPKWTEIRELMRNAGQPLRSQYVAYFALLESGMKSGETKDIVQRYCNINRDTPIRKMWYINVESKEQAKAAEHALHMIFDHARCMSRQQNKKDYYECDPESAEKFLTANMKKIFEAIVAEVAKVEG